MKHEKAEKVSIFLSNATVYLQDGSRMQIKNARAVEVYDRIATGATQTIKIAQRSQRLYNMIDLYDDNGKKVQNGRFAFVEPHQNRLVKVVKGRERDSLSFSFPKTHQQLSLRLKGSNAGPQTNITFVLSGGMQDRERAKHLQIVNRMNQGPVPVPCKMETNSGSQVSSLRASQEDHGMTGDEGEASNETSEDMMDEYSWLNEYDTLSSYPRNSDFSP